MDKHIKDLAYSVEIMKLKNLYLNRVLINKSILFISTACMILLIFLSEKNIQSFLSASLFALAIAGTLCIFQLNVCQLGEELAIKKGRDWGTLDIVLYAFQFFTFFVGLGTLVSKLH